MNGTAQLAALGSVHHTELVLFFTLLQLVIIVICARAAGELAIRWGQSRAVGEIIIGILLGPSLFGLLSPDLFHYVFRSTGPEPMTILSQVGLILLMFQIGLEFDFSHLTEPRNRTAVMRISAAGLAAPFLLGLGFGYFSAPALSPAADRLASALFIATAFSITALPILGRIMMELDMTRTSLGVIAISAAAINDVVGWLLLAVVTALTAASFSAADFALKLAVLTLYVVLNWWVVRPFMHRIVRRAEVSADRFSGNLLGIVLAAIFLSGMTTYKIGIFAIFGGFMMGVLLHDQPAFVEAWKKKVGSFVMVFFLPIFFTYTGLRTNIGGLDSTVLWGWCALLIGLATLGKFGACYWAARWSNMNHEESRIIGIMMNTRALMELIVINTGYDLGVISQNVFTMLVLMAIISTVITTPGLRVWLPRAGIALPARSRDVA
jgi:Kef-type K+ transport system membrane component KefB